MPISDRRGRDWDGRATSSFVVKRQSLRIVYSKKVYVFQDSVLSLGKLAEYSRSVTSWKDKIVWFTREMDGVVFEWEIIPGHTTLKLLQEFRRAMEGRQ